jgi:enoyl-CoA hydratase/carnithine racemase
MVAEKLICAIDQVDPHAPIIADAPAGPGRRPAAAATLADGSVSEWLMSDPQNGDRPVVVRRDGAVVTVVLDRPERRNALSLAMMEALSAELEAIARDPSARAVVLGAAGTVFCSGHDLREIAAAAAGVHERIFAACSELMLTIHRMPQPVVARVQGMATAAGCQLVAACDLVVASEAALFATPGVRIGLFCTTPMVEVARVIGRTRAMEMLLTGDPIDAPTALSWGFVNRVVPPGELDEAAAAFARRVASASGDTLAIGKPAIAENLDLPLEEAYRHAAAVMTRNAASDDAREGVAAFLEKRDPVWSHRKTPG